MKPSFCPSARTGINITTTSLSLCANHSHEFAAGMQSSSLKLFPSVDQKPMLLKRQAFAMFSGELDQYHLYLPLIQGTRLCSYIFFLLQRSHCVMRSKMFSSTSFRASHRDFAHESQRCNLCPNLPDVPSSFVADLITAPHVPLANHGHRAGMFPVL